MAFIDFINSLSEENKNNYNKYSKIRGAQQYRIIYETLYKINTNVTYKDVNSFIICDKAIKDVLFTYLGTLEEAIRNDILSKFDFESADGLKNKYKYFDNKFPKTKCIRKNVVPYEVTEFYKRFALNFGGMVLFIKEFMKDEYDCKKLDTIVELRNNVMHHSPLLFNCNFESTAINTMAGIQTLVDMLPASYRTSLITKLKVPNESTKKNIASYYYDLLLFKEK